MSARIIDVEDGVAFVEGTRDQYIAYVTDCQTTGDYEAHSCSYEIHSCLLFEPDDDQGLRTRGAMVLVSDGAIIGIWEDQQGYGLFREPGGWDNVCQAGAVLLDSILAGAV